MLCGELKLHKSLCAIALILLFCSVSAHAIYVDFPSTIIIQQEQKDLPVTIRNDEEISQDFSVKLVAPFDSFVSPSTGSLGAGKSTILSLSISPNEELEGNSFETTLEVQIGEEREFKNVRVIFKKAIEEEDEENAGQQSIGTGMFTFADFGNFTASIFTPENALNAVLAVVAAILLIAFISRFVKRMEGSK